MVIIKSHIYGTIVAFSCPKQDFMVVLVSYDKHNLSPTQELLNYLFVANNIKCSASLAFHFSFSDLFNKFNDT